MKCRLYRHCLLDLLKTPAKVHVALFIPPDGAEDEHSVTYMLTDHPRVTLMTSPKLHCKEVIVDAALYFMGSANVSVDGPQRTKRSITSSARARRS